MLFKTSQNEADNSLFGRRVLTPGALALKLQENFDQNFGVLWVEGELSELSQPFSGHAYFSLKDNEAKLKAVMWKSRRLYAGSALTEGLRVLARGRLAVYAPRGEYQLVVDSLSPQGEGALKIAFEKLKVKLAAEGFFDEDRKRPLPFWPARVAVISSPSGAAARDFIQTAKALRPNAAISLYPVKVQGPEAVFEIMEALQDLNAWGGHDLIVLTRGGGSLTDLWAFNEESLVRAVAASKTPVLAAIGHSTDLSLVELAADGRAITPTAAAKAVFRDQAVITFFLAECEGRLSRAIGELVDARAERIAGLARRLAQGLVENHWRRQERLTSLFIRLGRFENRLNQCRQSLDYAARDLQEAAGRFLAVRRRRFDAAAGALRFLTPSILLARYQAELEQLEGRLNRAAALYLATQNRKLELFEEKLKTLSPENILKRGYAIVTREPTGTVVADSEGVSAGEEVSIRLSGGRLSALVTNVEP